MCIGNGLNSTQYFDMNNCIIFNENVILPVLASMPKPGINISDLKLRNFITTFMQALIKMRLYNRMNKWIFSDSHNSSENRLSAAPPCK